MGYDDSRNMTVEVPPSQFQRTPASIRGWLHRAELDFALLGQVERILARDAAMMGAMVRTDPDEYLRLAPLLAALVERHVAIVDAATEAHEAIMAAFAADLPALPDGAPIGL